MGGDLQAGGGRSADFGQLFHSHPVFDCRNVTKMQVDTNVARLTSVELPRKGSDLHGGCLSREPFHGRVRQVRNAPINVQNVVTYDVVVEFDNPDFRLKPG